MVKQTGDTSARQETASSSKRADILRWFLGSESWSVIYNRTHPGLSSTRGSRAKRELLGSTEWS